MCLFACIGKRCNFWWFRSCYGAWFYLNPHLSCCTLRCAPSITQAFAYVGTEIEWVGEGVDEYGHVKGEPENILVRVDPRYFRPTEVELLLVSPVESSPSVRLSIDLGEPNQIHHLPYRITQQRERVAGVWSMC